MKCGASTPSSDGGPFVCDHPKGHTEEFHTDTRMHHTWYPSGHAARLQRTIQRAGGLSMPSIFDGNRFNSARDACDMLVGPCACGATHSAQEWQLTRITPGDCPHTYGRDLPRHRQSDFHCTCSDTYIHQSWLHALGCPEYAPQFINGG